MPRLVENIYRAGKERLTAVFLKMCFQGDPFLVFHLALVFLINAKEEILKIHQNERFL